MRALIHPRRLPVALRWFLAHGQNRNLPAPPKSFPAMHVELSARPGPPCPVTTKVTIMADKKLTPEDLRSASGGASKEIHSGPGSEQMSDELKRLRQLLNSEDDFSRVRYANLTSKELASVLGAGTTAVANALQGHGVRLERRKPDAPPTVDIRQDAEFNV